MQITKQDWAGIVVIVMLLVITFVVVGCAPYQPPGRDLWLIP